MLTAIALHAIVLAALNRGWECIGVRDGYNGLLCPADYPQGWLVPLDRNTVRGITHLGGTILGTTNRGNPLRYPVATENGSVVEKDRTAELVALFRRQGLDFGFLENDCSRAGLHAGQRAQQRALARAVRAD